jgi:hypothetical protein
MKKPLLAALGLAGACAACCALPVALTLVGGLSMAGAAAWIMGSVMAQLAVVGVAAAQLAGGAAVWRARRARQTCSAPAVSRPIGAAKGCGCAANNPEVRAA